MMKFVLGEAFGMTSVTRSFSHLSPLTTFDGFLLKVLSRSFKMGGITGHSRALTLPLLEFNDLWF